MATAGETKVKSPPKLKLGREPPSEEALTAECSTLMHIAAGDDDVIRISAGDDGDTPLCRPTEEEDFNVDLELDELEKEDYDFGFLRDGEYSTDEEEDAAPNGVGEGGSSPNGDGEGEYYANATMQQGEMFLAGKRSTAYRKTQDDWSELSSPNLRSTRRDAGRARCRAAGKRGNRSVVLLAESFRHPSSAGAVEVEVLFLRFSRGAPQAEL